VTLRLAFAVARYPPFVGGTELHTAEVARRLAALDVEVTVLTTDVTGTLPPREHVDGVEIRRLPSYPKSRDYYLTPRLAREVVDDGWDLLHVQGFQTLVAPTAMLAALRSRLPYVVTFHAGGHSSSLRKLGQPLQQAVLRPLLARAARLVALTPTEAAAREAQLRLPRERFVVVPNGSDLPAVDPPVERDPDLIASLGRLEQYKGHHRVIAALPYILAHRPQARLWLAGSGPYKGELRRLAADVGVADRVEFHTVPIDRREELAARLDRVSVAVSMSEFESHGIAVLEALGRGCRVVVARAPGLAVLAESGAARGVDLDVSAENLARAILPELDDDRPRTLPALPTWNDCAAALRDLYQAVLAERLTSPSRRPRPTVR
jgi:glycosyltransferase involved in cell wall biosynthesis